MGTEPPRLGKLSKDLRKAHCEKQQKLVRFLNIDFNTGTGRWSNGNDDVEFGLGSLDGLDDV